jgi:hypothetical protein
VVTEIEIGMGMDLESEEVDLELEEVVLQCQGSNEIKNVRKCCYVPNLRTVRNDFVQE